MIKKLNWYINKNIIINKKILFFAQLLIKMGLKINSTNNNSTNNSLNINDLQHQLADLQSQVDNIRSYNTNMTSLKKELQDKIISKLEQKIQKLELELERCCNANRIYLYENQQKNIEIRDLSHQLDINEETMIHMRECYESNLKEQQIQIDNLIQEINKLNDHNDSLDKENDELYLEKECLNQNIENINEQLKDVTQKNNELYLENKCLKHQSNKEKEKTSSLLNTMISLIDQNNQYSHDICQLSKELNEKDSIIDRLQNDIRKLQQNQTKYTLKSNNITFELIFKDDKGIITGNDKTWTYQLKNNINHGNFTLQFQMNLSNNNKTTVCEGNYENGLPDGIFDDEQRTLYQQGYTKIKNNNSCHINKHYNCDYTLSHISYLYSNLSVEYYFDNKKYVLTNSPDINYEDISFGNWSELLDGTKKYIYLHDFGLVQLDPN